MSLMTSLVSFWKLDELSGNAIDAHGSNDLTDSNSVGSVSGIVGNARRFRTANSEYFTTASNADLQTGDIDFSFSFWVRLLTADNLMFLISKGEVDVATREYGLFTFRDRQIRFFVNSDSGSAQVLSTETITVNTWAHIYCEHDATANTIGLSIDNGTLQTVSHSSGVRVGSAAFEVGARVTQSAYHDGDIDELGFWKRKLTAGERTTLFSGTAYPFGATAIDNRRRHQVAAGVL